MVTLLLIMQMLEEIDLGWETDDSDAVLSYNPRSFGI